MTSTTSFLIAAVLLSTGIHCNVDSCYVTNGTCRCYDDVIDCRSEDLTEIPAFNVDESTATGGHAYHSLLLGGNSITSIAGNAFGQLKLRKLDLMKMRDELDTIDPLAFSGLEECLTTLQITWKGEMANLFEALKILAVLESLEVNGLTQRYLGPNDLLSFSSLKTLKLTESKLIKFPTELVAGLPSLNYLAITDSRIATLGSGDIASTTLQTLDLSRSRNFTGISPGAFDGAVDSIRTLIFPQSQLRDSDVSEITKLTKLTNLQLTQNFVTSNGLRKILDAMPSLSILNVYNNDITGTLSRSFFTKSCRSLVDLNIGKNPLTEIDSNAFEDLLRLQTLSMDNIVGKFRWSFFSNLTELSYLNVESCRLGNIPDMTFANNRKLNTLIAGNNDITELKQRALSGLEQSLVKLYLNYNLQLKLDPCALYGFDSLSPENFNLDGILFVCNCSIKWIYEKWTQQQLSRTLWECPDETLLSALTLLNFTQCETTTTNQCDAVATKSPTSATESNNWLRIDVINVTTSSVRLQWSSSLCQSAVVGYSLNYTGRPTFPLPVSDVTQYELSNLQSSTVYRICIEQLPPLTPAIDGCVDVETAKGPISPIVWASLGTAAALLALIVPLAVCRCIVVREARRRKLEIKAIEPKACDRTKRFMKRPASFAADNDYRLTTAHRLQARSVDCLTSNYGTTGAGAAADDTALIDLLSLLRQRDNKISLSVEQLDRLRHQLAGPAVDRADYTQSEIYDEINDDETQLTGTGGEH